MKFIGRGKIYIAERDANGKPGAFKFLGCADDFTVQQAIETIEHHSKCTSADALDYQGDRSQSATFSLVLTEWNKKNLLLATRGTEVPTPTAGSVSGEACGTGFEAQDMYLLGSINGEPRTNVSAVTMTDGGGPLVEGTDYSVDAIYGAVTFLLPTTGAVTANYTYEDLPYASMLTAGSKDYWVRFNGVNKADGDAPMFAEFYKAQIAPAANLPFLPDELATIELNGACLIDETKDDSGALGQFGRVSLLEGIAA